MSSTAREEGRRLEKMSELGEEVLAAPLAFCTAALFAFRILHFVCASLSVACREGFRTRPL